jgi:hypothetical protein
LAQRTPNLTNAIAMEFLVLKNQNTFKSGEPKPKFREFIARFPCVFLFQGIADTRDLFRVDTPSAAIIHFVTAGVRKPRQSGASLDNDDDLFAPHLRLRQLSQGLRRVHFSLRSQSDCMNSQRTSALVSKMENASKRHMTRRGNELSRAHEKVVPNTWQLCLRWCSPSGGIHHGNSFAVSESCAGLFDRLECENAGIDFLANGRQGLTNEQKLVRRNLPALKPIAHGGGAHTHGGCGGGSSAEGLDDGFDCGQHAP